MNMLALDLGSKTGFAVWRDEAMVSGTKKLQYNKSASGVRFLQFRNWLIQTIKDYEIDRIYFERVYAHKGIDAAHTYGGFLYHLAAVCEELRIKCVGLAVGSIKKCATGKGNATKSEMIDFAKSCGFNPVDDNESDAIAILYTALKVDESTRNATQSRYFLTFRKSGEQTRGAWPATEKFQKFTKSDDKIRP